MNTHETYCSLETCKLLKQAGFDWEIDTFYLRYYEGDGHDNSIPTEDFSLYNSDYAHCTDWNNNPLTYINGILHKVSAPTLAVAQKWLREVKEYDVYIFPTTNDKRECVYQVGIKTFGRSVWIPGQPSTAQYETYEEALEAGIKKCLEIILEQK